MQDNQETKCDREISEAKDGDRSYLFRPCDDDHFLRTGRQIVEHCRLGISVETWAEEVKDLLLDVSQWCRKQNGQVRACFATAGAKITLFFVPSADSYDFELGGKLAELNVKLVHTFNVGIVEVLQVPWAELDRFIDVGSSRTVYDQAA